MRATREREEKRRIKAKRQALMHTNTHVAEEKQRQLWHMYTISVVYDKGKRERESQATHIHESNITAHNKI